MTQDVARFAVLLARPHAPKTETINDLDGLLSNVWRSIQLRPDEVALHAENMVSELDLQARHLALVKSRDALTERLIADPEFCDPKLAGWWVWGANSFIGGGWCNGRGPWSTDENGVLVKETGNGRGINRSLIHLGNAGRGVNSLSQREAVQDLSKRLSRVRMACGDFERVLGPSVTTKHGLTAVLLDPPYDAGNADNDVYGVDYDTGVAKRALNWAIKNGNDPLLRIAYCGYDLEAPDGWTLINWKANKGYQQSKKSHNGHRECIIFSPHCVKDGLF